VDQSQHQYVNTLAARLFRPKNQQQSARVFAMEYLLCRKHWKAVQTLQRLGKSSNLQWKKVVLFWVLDFLWVMS